MNKRKCFNKNFGRVSGSLEITSKAISKYFWEPLKTKGLFNSVLTKRFSQLDKKSFLPVPLLYLKYLSHNLSVLMLT